MHFNIITLFPELFAALNFGITGRAIDKKLVSLNCFNPRDYTRDPHRRIDDRPYGGGPGMVMQFEPLAAAITAAKASTTTASRTLLLSPQGRPLTQQAIAQCAKAASLILVCGRYEGIDERVTEQLIDEEWSIGDYVTSGGELPAMVMIDAIARLLPGVLGHAQSATQDSFSDGLLDHPHYTRPECIQGATVPKVLLSGDHEAINRWRKQQSLGKTWQKRPDLLKRRVLSPEEQMLLEAYIHEHTKEY